MHQPFVILAVLTTFAFAPGHLVGDRSLHSPDLAGFQAPPQDPPEVAEAPNLAARVEALEGDVMALQGDVASLLVGVTPVGTVVAHTGMAIPQGWVLCDGSAVSRDDFAALFAAIGTSHGEGDGATTFNLPDYRGRFLRGVDGGTGRDPNSGARTAMNTGGNTGDAVGSLQGDATALPTAAFSTSVSGNHSHPSAGSHNHGLGGTNLVRGSSFGDENGTPNFARSSSSVTGVAGNHSHGSAGNHAHSVTTGGDAETRPANAYVNWIIKSE